MIHSAQQVVCIPNDLVAALAFYVGNEADAATIVLEVGAIQAMCTRRPCSSMRALLFVPWSHELPWRSRRKPRLLVISCCRFWLFASVRASRAFESAAAEPSGPKQPLADR